MEFIIRKAEQSDIHGIMAIMEEAKRKCVHPEWFVADDEAYVKKHIEKSGCVLVAESEDQQLAGFAIVKYPEAEDNLGIYLDYPKEKLEKIAITDSVAVSETFRGNRLQEKMMLASEKMLDREKYRYLMCTIHPDNIYSLSNAKHVGYVVKKKIRCYGDLVRYVLEKEI